MKLLTFAVVALIAVAYVMAEAELDPVAAAKHGAVAAEDVKSSKVQKRGLYGPFGGYGWGWGGPGYAIGYGWGWGWGGPAIYGGWGLPVAYGWGGGFYG